MEAIPNTQPLAPLGEWEQADFALANGLGRVLLHGEPGTGKTYYGLHYHLNDKPSFRLVCNDEMSEGHILGTWKQETNDNGQVVTKFHEGPAVEAWRTGGRLVIDEINMANSAVTGVLMSMIDTSHSSRWRNPQTGEIVTPHPEFSVVATMNGEPDDLTRAIRDRLVVQLEINTPHPDGVMSLPEYLREIALSFGSRSGKDRYSLRNFVEFAQLYSKTGNLQHSAQVCLPRIQETLMDTILLAKVEA
jgi:MoxR-like ATPase